LVNVHDSVAGKRKSEGSAGEKLGKVKMFKTEAGESRKIRILGGRKEEVGGQIFVACFSERQFSTCSLSFSRAEIAAPACGTLYMYTLYGFVCVPTIISFVVHKTLPGFISLGQDAAKARGESH